MRSMSWQLGTVRNHPSICSRTQGNQENPETRWPVTGPSGYWLLYIIEEDIKSDSDIDHKRWQHCRSLLEESVYDDHQSSVFTSGNGTCNSLFQWNLGSVWQTKADCHVFLIVRMCVLYIICLYVSVGLQTINNHWRISASYRSTVWNRRKPTTKTGSRVTKKEIFPNTSLSNTVKDINMLLPSSTSIILKVITLRITAYWAPAVSFTASTEMYTNSDTWTAALLYMADSVRHFLLQYSNARVSGRVSGYAVCAWNASRQEGPNDIGRLQWSLSGR